jgi:LemA protein
MKSLLVVLGVVAVIGLTVMAGYNGLVSGNQAVEAQWAQVQNVYQRRADLIPNLVKTVEGAANFEKSTLTQITEARASVGKVQVSNAPSDPAQLEAFEKAQGSLGGALSRLLVVAERYPDLKANSGFQTLKAARTASQSNEGGSTKWCRVTTRRSRACQLCFMQLPSASRNDLTFRRKRVRRSRPK